MPDYDYPCYFYGNGRLADAVTVAFDAEWYDQTQGEHLMEIGIAIQPKDDPSRAVHRHYIIRDHSHYVNEYCPTSNVGFLFGDSSYIHKNQIRKTLNYWLSGAGNECDVELVLHNGRNDKRVIAQHNVDLDDIVHSIVDIGDLMILGNRQRRSLKSILSELGIAHNDDALHNAGNDAAYTLKAYNALKTRNSRPSSSARQNLSSHASVSMDTIHATGGFKHVYKGIYKNGPRQGEACVCKVFKSGGVIEASYFNKELEVVRKAMEIVDAFNAGRYCNQQMMLNQPQIWEFIAGMYRGQKALVEPFIANFEKFNSNTGWRSSSRSHWNQIVQALTHFSFHHTNGQAVLCDLQGGVYSNALVLSDPVVMSPGQEYGPTDLGNEGISSFFASHRCNMFCKPNWKKPAQAYAFYAAVSGSSMIAPSQRRPQYKPLPSITRIQEEAQW